MALSLGPRIRVGVVLHAVVNLAFAARALGAPAAASAPGGGPVHPTIASQAVAVALPHAAAPTTPTTPTTATTLRATTVRHASPPTTITTPTPTTITVAFRPIAVDRSVARFDRLADCESDRDTRAVSGPYRGAFQFLLDTWHDAGGEGDPVDASYEDQRAIAMRWSWIEDPARQWPVCWPLSA